MSKIKGCLPLLLDVYYLSVSQLWSLDFIIPHVLHFLPKHLIQLINKLCAFLKLLFLTAENL